MESPSIKTKRKLMIICFLVLLLVHHFKSKSYYLVEGGLKDIRLTSIALDRGGGKPEEELINQASQQTKQKILMNLLNFPYERLVFFKPDNIESIKIGIRAFDSRGDEIFINCRYYQTGEIEIDYQGGQNKLKSGTYRVKNLNPREIYREIKELSLGDNYVNKEAGFTFEIPEDWKGKFEIWEDEQGTDFFYTGYEDGNGGYQEFFSIGLISKEDYEKRLQDAPPLTGEFLDEKDGLVYLVNMPLDNIILSREKIEEYKEISLTVDEIRERFGILAGSNQEYYFEPSISTIEGRLITRMYYGPPNYGENPETDAKQYPFILQLDNPIDVLGKEDDDYNPDLLGIREIQVVPLGKETTDLLNTYIDKRVKIRGTLFEAIFGSHHTKVLIEVEEILE